MRKFFALTMLFALSSVISSFAAPGAPHSLMSWLKSENVRWSLYDQRASETINDGWKVKFPSLAESADADMADLIWGRLEQAKVDFHQQNLWLLTSGNDSLVGAMIDVEWAFDGIFFGCFSNMPGINRNTMRSVSGSGVNDMKFSNLYNELVAPKVKKLADINSLSFDPQSESVRFANAVKRWTSYNTVKWDDSDSLVEECPEKYFKTMGRGHKREDVRTEWVRVRNTIKAFHNATSLFRNDDNPAVGCALDDCEAALMKYFTRFARSMNTPNLKYETYSEVMRSAIDILCMEYTEAAKNAAKAEKNKLKSAKSR